MASAFSPNGFGSRSDNWESSSSRNELESLIWAWVFPPAQLNSRARTAAPPARIAFGEATCMRGSALLVYPSRRTGNAGDRRWKLENQTRDRRRPALRVYFTGRRLGSILSRPVPLLTSMI